MSNLVNTFRSNWNHFGGLLDGFEPIINNRWHAERIRNRKYGKQYYFPLAVSLYMLLETLYLHYTDQESLIFHHKIIHFFPNPEFFARNSDIGYPTAYVLTIIVFFVLIFDKLSHIQCISFSISCKTKSKTDFLLNVKLVDYWTRTKSKLRKQFILMRFQVLFTFVFQLIRIEITNELTIPHYQTNYRVWSVIGLTLVYVSYYCTVVWMGVYFIATNIAINIRQRFYLKIMERSPNSYRKYKQMMRRLLGHVAEVNMINKFYSKYITVTMFCYTLIGCSLANGILNGKSSNVPVVAITPWIFFTAVYIVSIILFCAVCSNTQLLNRKLFNSLRSMQTRLCDSQLVRAKRRLVHLDLVNEYKLLLTRNCFRLMNSSPLNNRLFYFEIVGFVSFVFMKIVRDR